MLSVCSRRRLSSISARSTFGRAPVHPPFVATMQSSGIGERAAPMVSSLSPPTYVWAVSMTLTPAATASLTNAMCSGVFVSRFVPSPIRTTSVSPSLSFCFAFTGRPRRTQRPTDVGREQADRVYTPDRQGRRRSLHPQSAARSRDNALGRYEQPRETQPADSEREDRIRAETHPAPQRTEKDIVVRQHHRACRSRSRPRLWGYRDPRGARAGGAGLFSGG